MKSETEQVQKARNGYVSSCEAAKPRSEAAKPCRARSQGQFDIKVASERRRKRRKGK